MKYLYLVFIVAFYNSIEAQQYGSLVYRISSEKLISQKENSIVKEKFISMMNSMSGLRDSLFFNLDFNNKESLFYLDKKKNIGISNEKGYNAILRSHGSSRFYRNDSILIEEINSDALYLVNYPPDIYKWQITKEKKKINEFVCFKATVEIKCRSIVRGDYIKVIEAWYCPEIPINLGPLNYGGLPGLICELKDEKLTYYLYSINLGNKPIIKKPHKGKKVSRDEYYKMLPHITRENFNEYIGN